MSHAGLTDSSRDCANNCLQFLKDLKLQATLPRADPSAVRYTVQRIHALGEVRHAWSLSEEQVVNLMLLLEEGIIKASTKVSVQNFTAIHPVIVEIFQSRLKCWTI